MYFQPINFLTGSDVVDSRIGWDINHLLSSCLRKIDNLGHDFERYIRRALSNVNLSRSPIRIHDDVPHALVTQFVFSYFQF